MGRKTLSFFCKQNYKELTTRLAPQSFNTQKHQKPLSGTLALNPEAASSLGLNSGGRTEKLKSKMENSERQQQNRQPLSEVVSDCVRRWFQDTLKEAKAGDIAMQVLVGQMYYSGYGVSRDAQKGRAWMTRASRVRSSVWKVSDKHPGYNASDSDSDEGKDDEK